MSETQEKVGADKSDLKVKIKKPSLMKKDKGPIKLDLRKKQEDAIQEQTTDEVLVRDEPTISEEVPQENIEKTDEQPTEEVKEEVIIEAAEEEVKEETKEVEKPEIVVPENLHKLVNFMNETGGNVQDYVRLNTDYTDVNPDTLLVEYYKTTKPHLDKEEIEILQKLCNQSKLNMIGDIDIIPEDIKIILLDIQKKMINDQISWKI